MTEEQKELHDKLKNFQLFGGEFPAKETIQLGLTLTPEFKPGQRVEVIDNEWTLPFDVKYSGMTGFIKDTNRCPQVNLDQEPEYPVAFFNGQLKLI